MLLAACSSCLLFQRPCTSLFYECTRDQKAVLLCQSGVHWPEGVTWPAHTCCATWGCLNVLGFFRSLPQHLDGLLCLGNLLKLSSLLKAAPVWATWLLNTLRTTGLKTRTNMARDPLPGGPALNRPCTEVWQALGLAFPPHWPCSSQAWLVLSRLGSVSALCLEPWCHAGGSADRLQYWRAWSLTISLKLDFLWETSLWFERAYLNPFPEYHCISGVTGWPFRWRRIWHRMNLFCLRKKARCLSVLWLLTHFSTCEAEGG